MPEIQGAMKIHFPIEEIAGSVFELLVDHLEKNPPKVDVVRKLLLTRSEVATMLNMSTQSVTRLEHSGRLKSIKVGSGANGAVRWRFDEVEAYIANCPPGVSSQ